MKELHLKMQKVLNLLFNYGHIDNRGNVPSKARQKKMKQMLNQIVMSQNISFKELEHIIEIDNHKILLKEQIPVSFEDKNTLKKVIVPSENFKEVDEDMIISPLNELKLLSYLYFENKDIENINIRLYFYNIDTLETSEKTFEFNKAEITLFFEETISKYLKWYDLTNKWKEKRNKSIKALPFPFESYREGQQKLAKYSYITIAESKKMFAQAPTGIGKTISTIFGGCKAIGEEKIDKIFYLTAKTVGRRVAEESFDKMRDKGLKFRNITLTAKDKICFKEKTNCNPVNCVYAKNYYGKVNNVIFEMLSNEEVFTRQIIEDYAKKYKVCPYELSLDLSIWTDAIICDYNYVFDPKVYLKRFFEEGTCNETLSVICDEAHNLESRARDMYSAEIYKKTVIEALQFVKEKIESSKEKLESIEYIKRILNDIKSYIEDKQALCINNSYVTKEHPTSLCSLLSDLTDELYNLFKRNGSTSDYDKLSEIHSQCGNFLEIAELFDDNYVFYVDDKTDTKMKLFCVNPAKNLKDAHKRVKSSIMFSATLTPLNYFKDVLGGDKDDYGVILESPFDTKNRELIIADNVSTKYKDRENTYDTIVEYIQNATSKKTGNYMIFLPSFDYMENIKERFNKKYPYVRMIAQENNMSEMDREVFLSKFNPNPSKTTVFFCVFGLFSEGIDLPHDELIGAIVVGVGLPMVCLERNLIKEFFDNLGHFGFDYAYTFPGMSKVMQSAGRVIRTSEDKGIIVLLDDRFGTSRYNKLFPKDWFPHHKAKTPEQVGNFVEAFWKNEK